MVIEFQFHYGKLTLHFVWTGKYLLFISLVDRPRGTNAEHWQLNIDSRIKAGLFIDEKIIYRI
ncbi:MAG TPA: hypothetical protein DCE78_09950 [Bacteroidetes bacterium]|nr:hypothetical protein [Bacteroidota bacterium]